MASNKKKVAVQIFGNLRTFEKCYKSLQKNLLDGYDCDIFIHTWNTIDHNTKTWHKYKCKKDIEITKELLEKYYPNLKVLKVENPEDLDYKIDGTFVGGARVFSLQGVRLMYHSIEQSNKIREAYEKENNVTYDYAISIRPDLKLNEPLVLEDYITKDGASIYTASLNDGRKVVNDVEETKGIDLILFAKPENLSGLFKKNDLTAFLPNLKDKTFDNGPEMFVSKLAKDNGLLIRVTNYYMGEAFDIIRQYKKLSLKRTLSFRIRKNMVRLVLFPFIANKVILSFSLFNKRFVCLFAIGKVI